MSEAFRYTPRFKDMRIKPPKDEPSQEERTCEYANCRRKATAKAPKSREQLNDFYWFCQNHASEYNKSWNFFDGLSEGAAQAYSDAARHGHRPTWSFNSGSTSRARATRATKDFQEGFEDPFSMFSDRPPPSQKNAPANDGPQGPRMGRLQAKALDTLGLEGHADKATVRKRYTELLRAYHPDSNGGDRSFEDQLQKVVEAYQILKNANMG